MKKRVKYKGSKIINIPFTDEEFKEISKTSEETGVPKYEVVRKYIFSNEFLNINK